VGLVVSDTSPISALAHVGHVPLLGELFGEVLIPPAVARELAHPLSGLPALELARFNFIKLRSPNDAARVSSLREILDEGEAEAIALAIEVQATALLVDERMARETARNSGLTVIGVVGILTKAKQTNLISAVKPLLDRLQQEFGFRLAADVREQTLRLLNEYE